MADNENNTFSDMTNQQPDSSTDSFEAVDARLREDIQHGYRSYRQENQASLSRVQGRLEARLRQAPDQTNIHSFEKFYQQRQKENSMDEKPVQRGRSRLVRTLSILVATLVVIAVISSAALLFNTRSHLVVGIPTAGTMTPTATVRPDTKPSPTPTAAIDEAACSSSADPGEQYLCSAGQEKQLNISTMVGKTRFTIQRGYADSQRVLLTTVSTINDKENMIIGIDRLTIQGGIVLFGGTGGGPDLRTNQWYGLGSFDASKIPAGTKELQITAHLSKTAVKPPVVREDAGTVQLTLPFHPEKRVATLNQTINVGGTPVTLDHVIVTPSLTRVYIKSTIIARNGLAQPEDMRLSVDGENSKDLASLGGGGTWTPTGDKYGTPIGWVSNYTNPLFDRQGTWTLQIAASDLGSSSPEPITFNFTVPPAQ
ncbi:hypothetical protein KDA_10610 [Dictyobacter alpinus]|uniref:Uncharacterized protein n=1 Tax=Dictyobacter alpinus TaxID=2014873 RepID=A0A402B2P1_9CHLR|nr:hypothetical protein [Dictyobacter alpinus]GCE25577.1 hypothetical protein KDA_10610 [Dictyobacter alpinus]